ARAPLQESALWSPKVESAITERLATIGADLEIWDTMRVGQYARSRPRSRRVLFADDLFSRRYATMLDRIANEPGKVSNPLGEFGKLLPGPASRLGTKPWVYTPLLKLERKLVAAAEDAAPAHFDATLLVSADETAELRDRSGNDTVRTLPPLLREPRARVRTFDGRPTFVFLGGLDFEPNRDGLSWFLGSCRDAVLAAVPEVEILVIGRGSTTLPDEAQAWGNRVRGLGWVDDLDGILNSAAALISPLRIGSGVKIKVLESLARGLPVVATPDGVLGLGAGDADGCLVATTPEDLAHAMRRAADPACNAELSARSAATWRRRFSPEVVAAVYDEVLQLDPQRARAEGTSAA
ncbi:MAG: glycosyltransferase family 4 protein, partial [Microlunatus sp.]